MVVSKEVLSRAEEIADQVSFPERSLSSRESRSRLVETSSEERRRRTTAQVKSLLSPWRSKPSAPVISCHRCSVYFHLRAYPPISRGSSVAIANPAGAIEPSARDARSFVTIAEIAGYEFHRCIRKPPSNDRATETGSVLLFFLLLSFLLIQFTIAPHRYRFMRNVQRDSIFCRCLE